MGLCIQVCLAGIHITHSLGCWVSCFPASSKLNHLGRSSSWPAAAHWRTSSIGAFLDWEQNCRRKTCKKYLGRCDWPLLGSLANDSWAYERLRKYLQCYVFLFGTDTPHRLAWIISHFLKPPSAWKCLVVFPRVQKPSALDASRFSYSPPSHKILAHPLRKALRGEGSEAEVPPVAYSHPGIVLTQASEFRPSWVSSLWLSRPTVLSVMPVVDKTEAFSFLRSGFPSSRSPLVVVFTLCLSIECHKAGVPLVLSMGVAFPKVSHDNILLAASYSCVTPAKDM